MRLAYQLVLALPLLLCTCGPAPVEPVADGLFVNLSAPDTTVVNGGALVAKQWYLRGDSVGQFDPFTGVGPMMPAYAADSSARFADSVYAVYQPGNAGTIDLIGYYQQHAMDRMALKRLPERAYRAPRANVSGKTYRFDVDGLQILLNFATLENPLPLSHTRDSVPDKEVDFRAVRAITLPDGSRTSAISYAEDIGNNQSRIHRLVVLATEDGTPEVYLRQDDIYGPAVIKGPFVGELYPSLVPDDEAEQNIFFPLSRGRIEVQALPPEPDSVEIMWSREHFLERGGINKRELAQLDFEFNEDGTYKMLVRDRILDEGNWGISSDLNYLIFSKPPRYLPELRYLTGYTAAYVAFDVPLSVLSGRPADWPDYPDAVNYYEPKVEVRFYRD